MIVCDRSLFWYFTNIFYLVISLTLFQQFKKNKTGDRGIHLDDSEEVAEEKARPPVAPVAPEVAAPPAAEPTADNQAAGQSEDVFAPPDQSTSWGDDFFKDPFANSPFNDPAKGDPYGFPETEPKNGDENAFFNNDSWGEPTTLPDINAVDSSDALSRAEMSEITNPTIFSPRNDKKEANRGFSATGTDSKENYSSANKNSFPKRRAEELYKQTQSAPAAKMETHPSTEEREDNKPVSNLMAKSRIMSKYGSKYGKNRKEALRSTDSDELAPQPVKSTPPRPIKNANSLEVQQSNSNELLLAKELAIARQREIDIATAKARHMGGASPPPNSKGYRGRSGKSANNAPLSIVKSTNSYPRSPQKKKVSPSLVDNPSYYSVRLLLGCSVCIISHLANLTLYHSSLLNVTAGEASAAD